MPTQCIVSVASFSDLTDLGEAATYKRLGAQVGLAHSGLSTDTNPLRESFRSFGSLAPPSAFAHSGPRQTQNPLRNGSGRSGARLRQAYGAAGTRPTKLGYHSIGYTDFALVFLARGKLLEFAGEGDLAGGTHPINKKDAVQVVGLVLNCSRQ
jgi:hypothetical protein